MVSIWVSYLGDLSLYPMDTSFLVVRLACWSKGGHICGMYLGALLRCLFGYLIWVVYRGDLQRVGYRSMRLLGLLDSSIWCVI